MQLSPGQFPMCKKLIFMSSLNSFHTLTRQTKQLPSLFLFYRQENYLISHKLIDKPDVLTQNESSLQVPFTTYYLVLDYLYSTSLKYMQ